MSWLFEAECRPKCRSKRHALEFHSSISKGTLQEVKAYARLCHNATKVKDTVGRSAVHVAAACGKGDVVEWLIAEKHADLTDRDSESGWTALHRALFYGQIPVARQLTQLGSDLYCRDHEGLSPLDIVLKDQPKQVTFLNTEPNEVYAWGDNSNFNLGLSSGQSRTSPDVIDEFKRAEVSIKDVVLCKYHTVFLSQSGQVYTCGHGHGGRLGHENELTCVVPKLVQTVKHETCIQITASRDHTALLMENGAVYSCGLNAFHQLGQLPPPAKSVKPNRMSLKMLKAKTVRGICVGRFHTVVYTSDSVYTCGLNAGQLGHQKGEKLQSQPKIVTALSHKDIAIESVTCSDAATVCLTTKGDVFVLHEYQCRRITSKWVNIEKVLVYGGHLDHVLDSKTLRKTGGSELFITFLSQEGKLFVWRESSPVLRRCQWSLKRQLYVVDVVFSDTAVAVITDAGEAFTGYWSNKKQGQKEQGVQKKIADDFEKATLMDLILKDEIETVQMKRLANIHRGTNIFADKKLNNVMVLQVLPYGCLSDLPSVSNSQMSDDFQILLDEADEYDTIHDVVVQSGSQRWACHRYILASRCDYFKNKVVQLCNNEDDDFLEEAPIISVNDIPAELVEQILKYIYTDTCDLLKIGSKFDMFVVRGHDLEKGHGDMKSLKKEDLVISENLSKLSAYEVQQKMKKALSKEGSKEKSDQTTQTKNPVKYLQEIARQLGVKGLSKRLDAVKFSNGCVQSAGRYIPPARIKFDRIKLPELYDVCIASEDGESVECHKCVLVARLEYFHSMLGSGWIETSNTTSLTLPVPGDVLALLLDYLYSDESPAVTDCQQVELLCNVLVVSDQLLITRLKEMCEVSLANLITFRNVGDILEFASIYNATQLRATCQQFISLNLAALLEGRYLDTLSDETITELKDYYRNMLPCMSRRMITPYSGAPEKDFLETLASKYVEDPSADLGGSTRKTKSKKRRSRTKSTSDEAAKSKITGHGSPRERQTSLCSDISVEEIEETPETTDDNVVRDHAASPGVKTLPALNVDIPVNGDDTASLTSPPSQANWASSPSPVSPDFPSPQSPPAGVSFRDIMQQQEKAVKSKQTVDKRGLGGKFSWKDVKKQQNKAAQNVAEQKSKETAAAQHKQSSCPWGSVNKVVQSFRELMLEEKVPAENVGSTASARPKVTKTQTGTVNVSTSQDHISWGLPARRLSRPQSASSPEAIPVASAPSNPWIKSQASSPPVSSVSFSDIMRDEQERKRTLEYVSKKPLHLIQIEEQAIQELLIHYKAAGNPEECITVERVPREQAAPVWTVNKQKTPSTKF